MLVRSHTRGCDIVRIRRMHETDIPAALALVRPQNWNQTEEDWLRFMALEPEGCFVAVIGGQVVGTTTTERFDRVGWIGMVTVAPERRGNGIGRALMQSAIAYLRGAGVRTVKLDATPMGRPLYDKLGFVPEYPLQRVVGRGRPLDAPGVRRYQGEPSVFDSIAELDRATYGVDRREMLRHLAHGWPELAAVHRTGDTVDGYVLGRHGHHYEHLGPMVALHADAAEALLRWGIAACGDRPAAFDHPVVNEVAVRLGRQYGFEPAREFTRMHLGSEPFLDRAEFLYASSGAEKG
ncbi:MAG: GNAT family N-acetyltransferase [Anaerolineae bacterium]|nr:GNAT family N-acetyltransferase [Anaerolineae bacterium]